MIAIDLFANGSSASEAIAVMHRAFAEYTAKGQPSGALLETSDTLRAELADGVRLGVVRDDDRVVAMVKHRRAQDGTLYFSRLGVDPDARGRRLAARLVAALREQSAKEGLSGLSCAVRADETSNIALYEHLGMKVVRSEQRVSLTGAVLAVVVMHDRDAESSGSH